MEGIFIPVEFYKDKNLNSLERDVLALYKYYTENGKNKCCSLNNTQIADILNVSTRYLRMVKKHLSELGYIRTDGGIKVTYLGLQVGSTVPTKQEVQFLQVGSTVPIDRKYSSYQVGSTVPTKQEVQFLHKKEKEEKKDKKEKKEPMTNLDILLSRLSDDYKTPERIEYIKTKYSDIINNKEKEDFIEGGILDSWVRGIKDELNQVCPMEYHIVKEEPINNTVDVF